MHTHIKKTIVIKLAATLLFISACINASAQRDTTTLKVTLPASSRFVNGKPVGKGWVNLLDTAKLSFQKDYWQLSNGVLHGECNNQPQHYYSYTKKIYTDFELNVLIKMTGNEEANSGVCIRIHPTDFDNVPGYQVDMGKGYWGSLWEERRANMVQKYPDSLSNKLVKANDWNHYYIIAKGHHIQAWLNGVKTIDIVHPAGLPDGNIGIQLCHGDKHTSVDVKAMYVKPIVN